ncbi:hypothetical protein NIES4103_35620 [Nostoc sp. NIES-4103]|nr:hypothetical protein NIES4103_35620 [Nostoc sp. NIES-4103]
MSEKSLTMYQMSLDPPKSPLKRGTLILVPPFLRGVRGDLNVLKITAEYFSDILLRVVKTTSL